MTYGLVKTEPKLRLAWVFLFLEYSLGRERINALLHTVMMHLEISTVNYEYCKM